MPSFFELSIGLVLIAMAGSVALLVLTFLENAQGRMGHAALAAIAAVFILNVSPVWAADQDTDTDRDRTVHFSTSSGLHFYAGGEVEVSGVADELFVAGGEVDIRSPVNSAMTVVGGDVSIRDAATDRAILSGGNVEFSGVINKNLIAAGGNVEVEDNTQVTGDVILAGGQVWFNGGIGGDFIGAGGEVRLAGSVGGNVVIHSSDINIAPGTVIAGNLTYRSPSELKLPPDVVVDGEIVREEWRGDRHDFLDDIGLGSIIAIAATALIATIAALFLFAAVMMAIFSSHFDRANSRMSGQPLQSFGLGVLMAIMLPTAAVVLLVTIIGIPLGLFAMAAFAVLFGLGVVVAGYWAGLRIRKLISSKTDVPTLGPRLGWMLVGLIVFSVIGIVPILGNLIQFLAAVTGSGAFVLAAVGDESSPNG